MNTKNLIPLLFSCLILAACDQNQPSDCSSETAQRLVAQTVLDAVEKKVANEKDSAGGFIFDKAEIRASLNQLQISIDSIRTTKQDPNSSKKFCAGQLKVNVPSSLLADADQTKDFQSKLRISQYARQLNIENEANVFSNKDFAYSVQPTDDGKELYVEVESTIWVSLLSDITTSALLKPILEVQKAEQVSQAIQTQQEIEQLKQETEASRLEAERLQALQEKQQAEQLKQQLLEKQVAADTTSTTEQSKEKVPKFKDYPAEKIYKGKNHALVLDSFGKQFKTRLSDAIKNTKPSFAGHYLVAGWGCGTSGCNTGAVIDAITGKAYSFPVALSSVYPMKSEFEETDGQEQIYRLNSRLMIFAGNLEGLEHGDGEDTVAFYEFKDGKFILLKTMRYGRKKP